MLPFLFLFEAVALMRHVRHRPPDVIYAHWFTPQGVVAAFVSRRTGIPYVLTSHAEDVRVWRKLPVEGPAVVRHLLPRAARLTAVSPATRDKMRAFFSDKKWRDIETRVAVLPMGVDGAALDATRADTAAFETELGLGGERVIAFVGRLVEKKGVAYLVNAFAHLVRTRANHDLVLVVAGDGPLREELRSQVRRLGLEDRVRFPGYVSGRRKAAVFRVADVVAVPSVETAADSEGFPVVVLEALAAGRVCVATDATHADGVVSDGVSGYLVPQRDTTALATALDRALAMSDSERQSMVDAARTHVADLNWAAVARQHYAFLLEPFEPRVAAS
jgi:glycosyltransferase involved in cell wall biosynthesis